MPYNDTVEMCRVILSSIRQLFKSHCPFREIKAMATRFKVSVRHFFITIVCKTIYYSDGFPNYF